MEGGMDAGREGGRESAAARGMGGMEPDGRRCVCVVGMRRAAGAGVKHIPERHTVRRRKQPLTAASVYSLPSTEQQTFPIVGGNGLCLRLGLWPAIGLHLLDDSPNSAAIQNHIIWTTRLEEMSSG